MKKSLSILMLLVISFSFNACSLDDDDNTNFKYVNLKVLSAEVPESFDFGERYTIYVTYAKPNACTYFEGFDIHKHQLTEREVYPIGTELIGNDNCQASTEEVEVNFDFEVIYKEDYLFKFWTGQNEDGEDQYIEFTVPVNQ
ncbi:hypothetical protein [Cellulophaga omnivescoria]|uniref:hypothetical protein n=1 Tax=Cellulophaga omnivescoria TaxID=1888890 RepID=UPI0022F03877|nr:hypothetical protein [Cellulophaga omnivescoria]WBU90758.1 hypothetical protein PBN93_07005 [Cellulophaga omnivescoria]WKB82890.1 hypothetical protein QYR09_07585 [Cellulophaga lytica]